MTNKPKMTTEEIVQKELDPGLPEHIAREFTGDSVNELRSQERANEYLGEKMIEQINENS
ncbi:hypothetical protein GN156_09485 [bacterium LRH843]|nr:hypothetical protein [bacterium LRH843]